MRLSDVNALFSLRFSLFDSKAPGPHHSTSPFRLKCQRVDAPTNVVHHCRSCWWSQWKTPLLVTNKSYFFRLSFCNLDLSRVRLPQLSSISILVSHSCSKLISKALFNSMTERYLAFRNAKDELGIIIQARRWLLRRGSCWNVITDHCWVTRHMPNASLASFW